MSRYVEAGTTRHELTALRALVLVTRFFVSCYQLIDEYMKFIVGTKEVMTQLFDNDGVVRAGTVIKVPKAVVTAVRTKEKDGYEAIQIASGAQKNHRVSKAVLGHAGGAYKHMREYRTTAGNTPSLEKGATYDAGVFTPGDTISVSALTKGRGFQGVVKRHGFGGGRASHGQKHSLREPGAIGGGGRAGGRVSKGMRMAGRMGGERVTIKNLTVLAVDPENETLVVSGAVPGRKGTVVEIRGM
jgi:large subunit ribosomal protein L3